MILNKVLAMIMIVALVIFAIESKKIQRSNSNTGKRKNKAVLISKKIVVPTRNEPFSVKAARGLDALKNTMHKSAESAIKSTSKVKRGIKSYFSSDFEVLLLSLTNPCDVRPSEDDLERFLATTETFVRNMDLVSESNPYRVTLRKIWAKISEKEPQTVLKAAFLLHNLLRYSQPEDAVIYKNLILKMIREVCLKSKSKYFDSEVISKLSAETEAYSKFVKSYNFYVIKRAKAFASGFEEMKLVGKGMRTEDICAQVKFIYSSCYYFIIFSPNLAIESSKDHFSCIRLPACRSGKIRSRLCVS